MASTFLPSVSPSYGSDSSTKVLIKHMRFGDGYTQRFGDGIKQTEDSITLNWDKISKAVVEELIEFFDNDAKDGASFYWQNFLGETKSYMVLDGYKYLPSDFNNWNFSVTLTETPDA